MINEGNLPESMIERATMLEGILVDRATGGSGENALYEYLRREFMQNDEFKNLLPSFVRTYRNLSAFWGWIKYEEETYQGRRNLIGKAFTPLMDHLEGNATVPADASVSDTLATFDGEGVHAVWVKALARRSSDPEGAITVARTLLETVCKRIMDERGTVYTDKEDLPRLYALAARALNLAPDQHTEEPIKAILGGAMTVVNGIGTLRNRLSDAHGRGGRLPVRPSPRHASLAVNLAGTVATFLVETHLAFGSKSSETK
ncbi:abortive infection family protein [Agrobacterium fabrum]|uniref:abortive infection family protein n=1 Tax=Agrobacterium fabrum TaxID=1176649 RepID=UPI000DD47CD3|nr:abortive infection family protein [Agrobacterium fabrum]NTE60125.1 abortive infection family protein [Agrobacterium fabrum]